MCGLMCLDTECRKVWTVEVMKLLRFRPQFSLLHPALQSWGWDSPNYITPLSASFDKSSAGGRLESREALPLLTDLTTADCTLQHFSALPDKRHCVP